MTRKQKLPFYFYWDKKSIIWSIGISFLIIGILSFTFLPEITRAIKLSKLNGEAKGQIIFIKDNITMRQGRIGNQIIVASYEVRYQYEINGLVYTGRNILAGSPKISYYLEKIKNSLYKLPVVVRYDLRKPYRSLIEFE